jgi:hypothetical protein
MNTERVEKGNALIANMDLLIDVLKQVVLNDNNPSETLDQIDLCISKIRYLHFDLDEFNRQMANTPMQFVPSHESQLRDTFAIEILNGFLSKNGLISGEPFLVKKSYSLADEMLKQREIK